MLGLAAVPAFIQFLGFLCMPESPRWLVLHNNTNKARVSLQMIRASSANVEEELKAITESCREEAQEREKSGIKYFLFISSWILIGMSY